MKSQTKKVKQYLNKQFPGANIRVQQAGNVDGIPAIKVSWINGPPWWPVFQAAKDIAGIGVEVKTNRKTTNVAYRDDFMKSFIFTDDHGNLLPWGSQEAAQ